MLESEVIKPLVLHLFDPEQPRIPEQQLTKALDAVESWMVRRMLVRATTKAYNKVIPELITLLITSLRELSGDVVRGFLASQSGDSQYWPDDEEIRGSLRDLEVYRRLSRGRLRMVLEGIEDYRRGWINDKTGLGGERVARDKYAIEHTCPASGPRTGPRPTVPSENPNETG